MEQEKKKPTPKPRILCTPREKEKMRLQLKRELFPAPKNYVVLPRDDTNEDTPRSPEYIKLRKLAQQSVAQEPLFEGDKMFYIKIAGNTWKVCDWQTFQIQINDQTRTLTFRRRELIPHNLARVDFFLWRAWVLGEPLPRSFFFGDGDWVLPPPPDTPSIEMYLDRMVDIDNMQVYVFANSNNSKDRPYVIDNFWNNETLLLLKKKYIYKYEETK